MKLNQHRFAYNLVKGIWEISICVKRMSTHVSTFLRESIDGEAVVE